GVVRASPSRRRADGDRDRRGGWAGQAVLRSGGARVRERDPRGVGSRGGDGMTEVPAMSTRLREIADRLRDPEVSDEQAEALAREAADLVAKASTEIDRALREASA